MVEIPDIRFDDSFLQKRKHKWERISEKGKRDEKNKSIEKHFFRLRWRKKCREG